MLESRSRRLWFLLVVAVLALGLLACGSKINQENFDQVRTGMTMQEVQAILGPATEAQSVDVAIFSGTSSTWKYRDLTITVQFVNGKVVAKQLSKGGN